jgi:cell division protein FtsI/penicillin-binding protein 2
VRRQVLWLMTWFGLCCAALMGRLFVCMVFPDNTSQGAAAKWAARVTTKADLQRLLLLQTDDGRGRILFRSGAPWSGSWRVTHFGPQAEAHTVGEHSELTPPGLGAVTVGKVGLPDSWPDSDRPIQEQGRTGLEYTFDKVLTGRRPGYVGLLKNVHGEAEPGMVYQIAASPGVNIRTTVDFAWQRWAESALTRANLSTGSIVVLNLAQNQVLAMASRDDEQPNRNVAIQAQTPGSVFKLVTAAAALDSYRYRTNSRFYCSGAANIPGVTMNCWAKHGSETLLQALSQSCDVAFADVGWQIGRAGFEEMTRRLHICETNLQSVDGTPVMPGAESGVVFKRTGNDAGLLANTAIGQEDVRMTPIQAANLASTLANGGLYRDVRLALSAEKGHQTVRLYTTDNATQGMTEATALQIGESMRQAVTLPTGTAHTLKNAPVSCAVKTGTAELNPRSVVNGWMVGFAPYDHPQIAFCVFAGHTSSTQAHEVVRQITLELLSTYRQFRPGSIIS